MNSSKAREYLRAHVIGLVALFVALTGTAVAAGGSGQSGGDAKAKASVSVKKINKQVKSLKKRVAALEGKSAPAIPTTLPPSGAAGGVLSGTYPNPGLGAIVTRTANVAINAGSSNFVEANCAPGERIISGGGVFLVLGLPSNLFNLGQSLKTGTVANPGNGWRVAGDNETGQNGSLVVQAYCLQG